MTVVGTTKNVDELTLTFVAEFAAPVERVWGVWQDPRLLERWWGPPDFPATFTSHNLVAGGAAAYFMQGPDGERYYGWWAIEAVDEPNGLTLTDGFADETGTPDPAIDPSRTIVTLEPIDSGTRMTLTSVFPNLASLEAMLEMGMMEGMTQALEQVDALLA